MCLAAEKKLSNLYKNLNILIDLFKYRVSTTVDISLILLLIVLSIFSNKISPE